MSFQSSAYPDRCLEFTIKVIDVITGGDASVPLPRSIHEVSHKISNFLSSETASSKYIDFSEPEFALALMGILLPTLFWNILGRLEYYTRFMSRLCLKPIIGVYVTAAIITSLSMIRSALFIQAIRSQPKIDELNSPIAQAIGGAIFVIGFVLIVGSYYRLGIRGTYLGDYFGFLMDDMITAFPFNVVSNPMYDGSSLFHLGEAILERSPAGIMLAGWLFFVYRLGCTFEEPFTFHMYKERDEERERARLAKLAETKTT